MCINHAARPERSSRAFSAVRSGFMKPVVLVGYFIGYSLATAATADAHVKWFVNCNVSDDPLPLHVVFTTTFFVNRVCRLAGGAANSFAGWAS
jgi:hypothetical protein